MDTHIEHINRFRKTNIYTEPHPYNVLYDLCCFAAYCLRKIRKIFKTFFYISDINTSTTTGAETNNVIVKKIKIYKK